MKSIKFLIFFQLLAVILFTSCSNSENELPITVQHISSRVINLKVGDVEPFGDIIKNNVAAVSSQKGLIFIDTGYFIRKALRY